MRLQGLQGVHRHTGRRRRGHLHQLHDNHVVVGEAMDDCLDTGQVLSAFAMAQQVRRTGTRD